MKQIFFNTDMVRAILDDRKTETRRAIKPQPPMEHIYPLGFCTDGDKKDVGKFGFGTGEHGGNIFYVQPPCRIGDILYVRETWGFVKCKDCINKEECFPKYGMNGCYIYRANYTNEDASMFKWRPSIHMTKRAARIFLQVTDVRVERLQDINSLSIQQEGVETDDPFKLNGEEMRYAFSQLWTSTVKKEDLERYGWDANPWVWVVKFERIEKPREDGHNDKKR